MKKIIVVCKMCHNDVKHIWLEWWVCDNCHAMIHESLTETREIDIVGA